MCTFAAKVRERREGGGWQKREEKNRFQIYASLDQINAKALLQMGFSFFPHDFEFRPHIFKSIGLCRNAHLYYLYHAPLLTEHNLFLST